MVTYHPKSELSGGYAGLQFTASQIAAYIPNCKIYCEPFAGLGRVAKHVTADKYILNDKSEYAFNFLKSHFTAEITNLDFEECIKLHDSENTFFLFDPPWRKPIYDNDKAFIDRTPKQYFQRLLEIVPNLKADWFICSSLAERGLGKILTKSGFPILDIKSHRLICGKPATVRIIARHQFIRQQPKLEAFVN